MLSKPPIRIGNVSGATGDHPHAMKRMVEPGGVDVITGDRLSEMSIAWNAITKRDVDPDLGYENGFYLQLEECLDQIMEQDIKVATNAGALNTMSLFRKVQALCVERGYKDTVVAAILGDDVSDLVTDPSKRRSLHFPHLDHQDRLLDEWSLDPICANAYFGCRGIVKALEAGANIVILTFYINGLDVEAKVAMMRQQLDHILKGNKFSRFSVEQYGSQVDNPRSQQGGTVQLRVFAQARNKADIEAPSFKISIYALRMQSYPGYHMNLDFRTMDPRPFMEIFPVVMPLSMIDHRVVLSTGQQIKVDPPQKTVEYPVMRPSSDTEDPIDLQSLGPTKKAPFGSIVHARSGDKADNSNIGFFVRHDDEYPWLKTYLTVSRLKELFGDDWQKGNPDRRVERVEFPGINAVHFRVLDNLNGGIASSDRIDGLGKGIAEYLRSRSAEIPIRFLQRGWI
ncbi:hypothetical protein Z517_08859 [Fonsecaea pedrosoi CBS 271.37]|uniref:Uncharacterized protein n=1 Tax=Fonsecaea pedrosoi CBS 271.37 TaxID=1442368 RepID=A0A0D2H373_9EURO|nr:uncharacterized protein Z517_08859 [Fonsecaea pedrosoi CBS 271.37]KIW79019.1 hypothetical protein Z517_08859 [Fonsecaea pedrosoi CBS 271.37]